MDLLVWIVLGVIYLAMFVFLGLTTLNKGHTVLFFVGFVLPLLWIVGAVLPRTNAAAASRARANLR